MMRYVYKSDRLDITYPYQAPGLLFTTVAKKTPKKSLFLFCRFKCFTCCVPELMILINLYLFILGLSQIQLFGIIII